MFQINFQWFDFHLWCVLNATADRAPRYEKKTKPRAPWEIGMRNKQTSRQQHESGFSLATILLLNLHHARSHLYSCRPGWHSNRRCMLYVPSPDGGPICLWQNKTGELYTREHELSVSTPSADQPTCRWYASRRTGAFSKGLLPPARVVSRHSSPKLARENMCPVLST